MGALADSKVGQTGGWRTAASHCRELALPTRSGSPSHEFAARKQTLKLTFELSGGLMEAERPWGYPLMEGLTDLTMPRVPTPECLAQFFRARADSEPMQ